MLRLFAFLGLLSLAFPACLLADEKQPHIVLCMTDDQGWGDVSYNGLTKIKTKNLDAMAQTGLRFNRFYAAAPVCSPTRGSVMTGRHPNRFGCFLYGYPIRPQEVTLAQMLKKAGYATGHFGKWHLNGVSGAGKVIAADDPLSPGKCGFDEWLSVSNFFDLDWTLSRKGTPEKFAGDGSDYIVGEAVKFIKDAHKQKKPSFTVIWFGNPHTPHKALPEDLKNANGSAYYGEILAIDRSMGALREELQKLGIADNTLIWFCSDNGAASPGSTGGLRGMKSSIYEGGVRVPGIVVWPSRIPKHATTEIPAVTSDIFPTILDIVGLKSQTGPLDGISLLPLFDANMKERTGGIGFWQYKGTRETKELDVAVGHSAWTDNRFKLHRLPKGTLELYDLTVDPSEQNDLAASQRETVARMKRELDAWQASVANSFLGKDYPPAK